MIEATEGDRVRIYVTNKLPEPTTVHWHGMLVPNGMDGVAGLTQTRDRSPARRSATSSRFDRAGTFMYHPHFDEMTQIALGMMGMIVVHPRDRGAAGARLRADRARVEDRRSARARPDPLAMTDFNVLTFNGKAFPATAPLVAETGERVRIRFGNLGPMDHHPIHLHGHTFEVVATDGGPIAEVRAPPRDDACSCRSARRARSSSSRDAPGDWAMHCHMTHHAMNQMGHDAANLIGVDTTGLDARAGPRRARLHDDGRRPAWAR